MAKAPSFLWDDLSAGFLDDRNILHLIEAVRKGISYSHFASLVKESPFTLPEWTGFLHLSDRTLQRYKREQKAFEPMHSEKILAITLLYRRGAEIFGDQQAFASWLNAKSVALGGIPPKTLLDTSFGINLVQDELTRVEHGVLA